jgi:predicted transcriptional regulator
MAVARNLTEKHGMSQKEVAVLLGIRQASVSNYSRSKKSDKIAKLGELVLRMGFEKRIVDMALSGKSRKSIAKEIERVASDRRLVRFAAAL